MRFAKYRDSSQSAATLSILVTWLTVVAATAPPSFATPPRSSPVTLTDKLNRQAQVTWSGAPLRPSLLRLASAHQVPVVVDRRIDPATPIDAQPATLRQVLERVAGQQRCGVSFLPHVVYVGPFDTTHVLATSLERIDASIRQLKPAQQTRWKRSRNASWPELTEPRALITTWLQESQVSVSNLEAIPYDLWPQQDLPALPLTERLVIVLAGFQLSPQIDDKGTLTIVALPSTLSIERTYTVRDPRQRSERTWLDAFPDITAVWKGESVTVAATSETHRMIEERLQNTRSPRKRSQEARSPSSAQRRFSLQVQQRPLGQVLNAIAQQAQLEVVWSPGTEHWQQHLSSATTDKATLAELLTQLVQGTSLTPHIEGGQIILREHSNPPAPTP